MVAPPPPPRTMHGPAAEAEMDAVAVDLEGFRRVADGENGRRLLLIGPPLEGADTRYPFWHELAVLDLETMKIRALPPVAAVGRLGGEPIYTVRWQATHGGRPREPCASVVTSDEQVLVVPCAGLPPPSFAEIVAPPPDAVLIFTRPRPR